MKTKFVKLFSMFRNVMPGIFCFISGSAFAQPITKYVCPTISYSTYINNDIKAGKSDGFCNTGTEVKAYIVSGTTGMATVSATRLDGGPHRVQVNVNWTGGVTGVIFVNVEYRKRIYAGVWGGAKCKWTGWRSLYTYKFIRNHVNPGGTISGVSVSTVPTNETESQFNLTYAPGATEYTSFGTNLVAKKIRYRNGRDANGDGVPDMVETPITKSTYYVPTPITFYPIGRGSFNLNTEVYTEIDGSCGEWVPGPSKTVNVYSSCYLDDISNVIIAPEGVSPNNDGTYTVNEGQPYILQVSGITDFASNYSWATDGGANLSLSGNTFTLHSPIGSYRIIAVPNAEGCPSTNPLQLVIGGNNTSVTSACTITLPQYFTQPPYNFPLNDVVFQHFATYVESERNIIVEPGITLELGAELFIKPGIEDPVNDLALNFVEKLSYDEYGRILGESRAYFNEKGDVIQSQYKNLTENVVLANATLYDALGRVAITTLPAPITTVGLSTCDTESDDTVVESVSFAYKADFVKGAEGQIYSISDYDLTRENNPVALDATTEGTVGWYYSTNNGSSDFVALNEPWVATSGFPYSRILYHNDGSGRGIKGTTRPGDAFKAGSGKLATSFMEPVSSDDPYFSDDPKSYLSMRERELNLSRPTAIEGEFFKMTGIDEMGRKSVGYSDKSGNKIISIYFGSSSSSQSHSFQLYDDTGKLRYSISPNGLAQYEVDIAMNSSNFAEIDKTAYFYDGRGILVATEEKFAGENLSGLSRSEFISRKDGRIRFSQNEEQRKNTPAHSPRFSYSNYDRSGRVIESGEYIPGGDGITFSSPEMFAILENLDANGGLSDDAGIKQNRAITFYDLPDSDGFEPENRDPAITDARLPENRVQRFVMGGVSYTQKDQDVITWYSYDERGRVEWIVQYIKGLGRKTIDYRYGLIGQVQEIAYQKDSEDGDHFSHFFEYDRDGRISKVYTSTTVLEYDKFGKLINPGISYNANRQLVATGPLAHEATYYYYKHGPLKRIELATRKIDGTTTTLQGIDYLYMVDGALKSINHADPSKDPNMDGAEGSTTRKDVFGMTLEYFTSDYESASVSAQNIGNLGGYVDQYTGLIKAVRWHSPIDYDKQLVYAYRYDDKNQFLKADWGTIDVGVFMKNPFNAYQESIGTYDNNGNFTGNDYDLNGNILNLNRSENSLKSAAGPSYSLSYNYKSKSNLLESVSQTINGNTTIFRDYHYDNLGQTISEVTPNGSRYIDYDVTGKMNAIYQDDEHMEPIVTYSYDDRGFRLSKTIFDENFAPLLTTWYVRDISGKIMSVYDQDRVAETAPVPSEMPVYGLGKIGTYRPSYGLTMYELNDHLGNVRAVIGGEIEAELVATMESERAEKEAGDGFIIVKRSATSTRINHTPAVIEIDKQQVAIENPNEVTRLNNRPNNIYDPDPIGTGIMLLVHPGDVINAEVFVKCADFSGTPNPFDGMVGFLTETFKSTAIVDGNSIFNIANDNEYTTFLLKQDAPVGRPKVFLSYILFDKNFQLQDKGFDYEQATDAAIIPAKGFLHEHERLSFEDPIEIKKDGFLYIYVSNESDLNMDVYFDDLRIQHSYSNVVAGGDYYPFGLEIKDRQIQRDPYRFGYQGQFAEKDEETGWNHFELREYDPIIGRWLQKDPMRQFFSPYIGMGNNPVHLTDPRGGCVDGQGNVIPCPDGVSDGLDGFHTTVLGWDDYSFDAETHEYDYAGTFAHYQKSFPEFAGMSQADARAHWNSKYSEAFYKQWQESVQREKDRENVAKLAWFIQGYTTVGTISLFSLGRTSALKGPNSFSYSPRFNLRYHPRLDGQTDTYHNFPNSFDKHIIRNGSHSQRISDRAHWYEMPGSVNGENGFYQIGVTRGNSIFHRNFVPLTNY